MNTKPISGTSAWRDWYAVHPCADVFPMMSDAEIDELAADIDIHGLQQPIVLWRSLTDSDHFFVLDGRNRMEALARLGKLPRPRELVGCSFFRSHSGPDPAAFVISANIRRRHLTKEQQAELIVRTLEAGQQNERATLARSFSPAAGKKGGSTADPLLAAAVKEAKKHGISKRTVQNARAKVAGRTPKPAPRRPPHRPAEACSKEEEWETILRALRPARDLATNWPEDRDFEQFILEGRNLLTYLERLQSQHRPPDPMANRPALVIDHGPVAPSQRLREVSPERWRELVSVRRSFCAVHLKYDCRELLRFVKEAADMLGPLGYADVSDFIRRGLELDPSLVEWASEGLRRLLKPHKPIEGDEAN